MDTVVDDALHDGADGPSGDVDEALAVRFNLCSKSRSVRMAGSVDMHLDRVSVMKTEDRLH